MAPSPVLARLDGQAWEERLDQLTDDELVGVLCAARRRASRAVASS